MIFIFLADWFGLFHWLEILYPSLIFQDPSKALISSSWKMVLIFWCLNIDIRLYDFKHKSTSRFTSSSLGTYIWIHLLSKSSKGYLSIILLRNQFNPMKDSVLCWLPRLTYNHLYNSFFQINTTNINLNSLI